jgi:asparagine synthetase A
VGALLTFLQTKVQEDIPGREQSVYSAVKKLGSLVMLALQEIEVWKRLALQKVSQKTKKGV